MIRERILARLVWFVVLAWSKTVAYRILNQELRERMAAEKKNCIYAFWHGSLLMLLQAYHDSGLVVPVSESRDGEYVARVLTHFGFRVARGSSKRKGQKALLALISKMRQGENVGITVDGPRGPLHRVKPGAAFLAGVLNAPIIPVAVAAKRAWVLEKSWDKLIVPFPFTEGLILFGNPIFVNGTSDEEVEAGSRELETELLRLTHVARAQVASQGGVIGGNKHGVPTPRTAEQAGACVLSPHQCQVQKSATESE